jgi:hypothetical protein
MEPIQDIDLFQATDPTACVAIFILYLMKGQPPSKMFVFYKDSGKSQMKVSSQYSLQDSLCNQDI